jgi:hypothetical protein
MQKKEDEDLIGSYDKEASHYIKGAIFTWCLVGLIYGAVTWHVLWLPGVLLFFPGIFIASLISAIFYIPLWFITKKLKGDRQVHESNHWVLLMLGTIFKIGGFIAPIVGSIGYIYLLHHFMK